MSEAWRAYDRSFADGRVVFVHEPELAAARFRSRTLGDSISPKVWADAWMLAVADAVGGVLVTFDRALAVRGAVCLLGDR